jgi:peroxiredoxin family protein
MSLTFDDLQAIRKIVEETVEPIKGDIEALSNDVKEIYEMLANPQNEVSGKATFKKSSLEEKILRLHAELVEAAKQANVTLPSH